MTLRKQVEQDALQHPNTWCSRTELAGVRMRFIPERRVMQIESSGLQETITGQLVLVDPPLVMEVQL